MASPDKLQSMRKWLMPAALTASLALCGAAWWMRSQTAAFVGVQATGPNLQETPRHEVSTEMIRTAESYIGKPLPEFSLPDSQGKTFDSAEAIQNSKPKVLIMTKDGCPCSMEAQINWNRMAIHYGGDVEFLAIMDTDSAGARDFQLDFGVPYRLLCSTDDKVFRLFGAKQSVFTYYVAPDGTIEAVWPGYNLEMVEALNLRLAKATGKIPWDTSQAMAPQIMTSGCFFFQPIGTEKPAW